MNRKNLDAIFKQYIDRFDELNDESGSNEGYKWKAENWFKEHWDIEADDFPHMFIEAMQETSNLIDNATVQPIGGIRLLLKHEEEVEYVRECFADLFSDDNGNLDERQNRMDEFIHKINTKIELYASGSWKYPQTRNSVIYYLNLWKPEENYIFKSTEATAWANCIEYGDDFGSGATFSLKKYYRMCDELLEEVKKNTEIIQLNSQRMKEKSISFDDQLHILVYDIIYCSQAYNFYTGLDIRKISTKQRIKNAENRARVDYFENVISEAKGKMEQLQSEIAANPDMTGKKVVHKAYGEGNVIAHEDGRIIVDIAGTQRTFQYPQAFQQGFLKSEEDYSGIFENNARIEKELKTLKNNISAAEIELKKLVKM